LTAKKIFTNLVKDQVLLIILNWLENMNYL